MAFPLPTPAIVGFCLVIGLLSLAWLGAAIRSRRRFMARARRAQGVVESLKRETYGRRSVLYFPVIRFTTDSGVTVSSRSGTGRNEGAYRVGETVAVLYDPDQPTEMRIDTFSSRWVGIMIPAFIGLVALFVGMVALLPSSGK